MSQSSSFQQRRQQLRDAIMELALRHGDFELSGGDRTSWYLDLRRIGLHWRTAALLGHLMLELTSGVTFAAVGGMTLGADPVASAMMHTAIRYDLALDAFVVRKQPKSHGTKLLIEGPDISGSPVLVVDDTTTHGTSTLLAIEAVLSAGATVACVAVVVDRGGCKAIRAAGYRTVSLFTPRDFDLT